jgi:TolB-like protein/Tfp pilus assembly protein PilF
MGKVYEGRDTRLGRRVAIKIVSGDFSDRFIREARAVASLNHPHICTLYDVGPNYLVMEYVEGKPLSGPLPLEAIREYALQIADALDAAHRKGVVHRDLKPDNILLTQSGIKLLDFGLAKLLVPADENAETLVNEGATKAGMLLGTLPYMSPEQAEGRLVDTRSDIFSFGTVLYELMSGQRPFSGKTQAATLAALLRDEPRPLRDTHADIPEPVAQAIARCLSKRPIDRFQTAAELKSALGQARWDMKSNSVSVAVLPFVNMNRDEDGEFFADGVAEDIISALAKLPGLRVVARSASFQFKGKTVTHEDVRDKLKVGVIVEGSVRRSGQRIRVTAELINAADGYQMWSERYDRVMEDVFAIQDEISRAIASKLEVKLRAGQKVVTNRTHNIEAYNLYLRGRQQWYKRSPAGHRRAEDYFRAAVAEDSGFVPALVGLADCLTIGTFYETNDPAVAIPEARKLLDRSFAMDPQSAEAHTSLAFLELVLLNIHEAERHFLMAHQLKPDQGLTIWWHACLLSAEGRLEEAVSMANRATQLEPTVPMYPVAESILRFYNSEIEAATACIRKVLEMEPSFPLAQSMLGQCLAESGQWGEGIELMRTATNLMAPGGLWTRGYLGSYLGRMGDIAGARKTLDELLALRQNGFASPVAIAAVYTGLGENDEAMKWLDQAAREPGTLQFWIPVDPVWEPLHSHPGFQKILARWKRTNNPGTPQV